MESFAVYSDATYKVYETKAQALASNPLFVAESFVISNFPTWNDPDRKKYGFNIFNSKGLSYQLNCDGWKIISIIKYFYRKSCTEVKIASPDGQIRIIDTGHSFELETVVLLLPFINEFRGYHTWIDYDLKQENLKLKKEIEEHKAELDTLKNNN